MSRRKRRTVTDQFKADAVRLCRLGDRSVTQSASELDLAEDSLCDWLKRAEEAPPAASCEALSTVERSELAELRKRVKRLEMEREILKKGDGLLRQGDDVKFTIAAAERALYPVNVIWQLFEVSRSGFYAWYKRPPVGRAKARRALG